MLNKTDPIFNNIDEAMRRIAYLEDQLLNITNLLNGLYQLGRTNTRRATPASSSDVVNIANGSSANFDLLYDRVLTPTNEYILINNSGTLEWRTIVLSSF